MSDSSSTGPSSQREFLLALAGLVALAALTLFLQWPRGTVAADADPQIFSAERAIASLVPLIEVAGGPHPVGTEANARVHEAVIAELEAIGWEVERQRGIGCRGDRTCAGLENLIARLPGQGTGPAVLVACHTDSVPAGVGAGDDGAGMAVMLEMARNLAASEAAGEPTDRPVWLLFDEGEEMGLLGAELFVRQMEPGSVGVVVNLEARGTTGPVWMFETSDGGGALVSAYARSVPQPNTSSIAYSVYKRMPNDTDLTVFRSGGLAGVGMAFIDGGARYHTPRDDLEHLSSASVQRMGDGALGLVRDLASRELPVPLGERVFFDLASLMTVTWPSALSAPLALLALVLTLWAGRRKIAIREWLRGLGAWLLVVLAGLAGGGLVYFALGAVGALPVQFPANISWATAAATVLALAFTVATAGQRWLAVSQEIRLYGALLANGILALAVSLLEPAACYPFLLAALIGGAVALLGRAQLTSIVTAAVLVLTLAALVRMLPVGLGPLGLVGSGLLTGLIMPPLLALLPPDFRLRPMTAAPSFAGLLAAAVLLMLITALAPKLTYSNPQGVTIKARVAVDAETGERTSEAWLWSWGPVPAEMADLFDQTTSPPSAAIEDHGALPVEVTVLAKEADRLRLHLRSPRAAWAMFLGAPEGTFIHELEWPNLEARTLEEQPTRIRLQGVAPEGIEVELRGELDGELTITDRALGLPSTAQHIAAARPEWATPIGTGDHSDVRSAMELSSLEVRDDVLEGALEDAAEGATEDAGEIATAEDPPAPTP